MKQWLFLFIFLLLSQTPAFAASMQNEVFQLELTPAASSPTPQKSQPSPTPQPTLPQTLLISSPFSFSSSTSFIDYGEFVPTEPVIRNISLNVKSKWPYGFVVLQSENHDLRGQTTSIPDTSCDNGSCTPTLSSAWVSILTYGFGFSCEKAKDTVCAPYNVSSSGFRPFANLQKDTGPQAVLFSSQGSSKARATLQVKVNTSKSQPIQVYQNNLQFVAIPKL